MSMWKYVVGGQPPKRKETQTPEEKKIRDQEYESKHHKRLFQEGWKKDRPWLQVVMADEVQVMFCDYCIAAGGQSDKNVFVKGCSNLKLELINIMKQVTAICLQ